ncbi:MAG: BrnT family toxin [bacterium]
MADLVFEWDSEKAASNLAKHCVSFEEALTVFADPLAAIHDDPDHSEDEERELIVGHSTAARLLIVSFTELPNSVRIISAREVTRRERRDYEASTKK